MEINNNSKHKVFISYYHKDDERYRNEFERLFGHLFINKSVHDGDIDSDLSDEYIKKIIQQGYITDSSVILVLVGANTYGRKHVDWEISAGLNKKVGGYSGLIGILLPTYRLQPNGNYQYDNIPPRLADNIKSGYANMYTWTRVCSQESLIMNAVEDAFNARVERSVKIVNTRKQFDKDYSS